MVVVVDVCFCFIPLGGVIHNMRIIKSVGKLFENVGQPQREAFCSSLLLGCPTHRPPSFILIVKLKYQLSYKRQLSCINEDSFTFIPKADVQIPFINNLIPSQGSWNKLILVQRSPILISVTCVLDGGYKCHQQPMGN